MNAIYGLYPDPDAAQEAVDHLRRAGVNDRDIVVISSEPFEEYEFSHRDKATWLYWIAGGGGAAGFVLSYLALRYMQTAWALDTAGMPIVAAYPNAIIMFEMTMLGAILATVVTLFITAKLPNRGPRLYDPEVSDGYILVGLENPADAIVEAARGALERPAGGRVRTI
ncbi:MAG: quinol:electron acceptor oxidoreductase subunit ActD [Acidobacteriota bacterium]